jgi:hypothetical protein
MLWDEKKRRKAFVSIIMAAMTPINMRSTTTKGYKYADLLLAYIVTMAKLREILQPDEGL